MKIQAPIPFKISRKVPTARFGFAPKAKPSLHACRAFIQSLPTSQQLVNPESPSESKTPLCSEVGTTHNPVPWMAAREVLHGLNQVVDDPHWLQNQTDFTRGTKEQRSRRFLRFGGTCGR
jgi:hypothetical protein